MISQIIHNNWKMREASEESYIKATIPGSVYSNLLENGLMEDPFYRDNEEEALKLSEKDYEFVTEFSVEDSILSCPYAVLKFFGLDTIADIWLNEKHLGYVNNINVCYQLKRPLADVDLAKGGVFVDGEREPSCKWLCGLHGS